MSAPTEDRKFYRVEEQGRPPDECQCANCKLWTVVYDDGEPTEIGTAYQGDDGKEAAEDVCDLMNMAYDRGQESQIDNAEETKLVEFFRTTEGGSLGRDGDHDGLTPAETALRAIRDLRRRLDNAINELTVRALNG